MPYSSPVTASSSTERAGGRGVDEGEYGLGRLSNELQERLDAPDNARFACPCHKSSFDLDGHIDDPSSPAPRDMDSLQVEIRNGDEVWVRFQNFYTGIEHQRPKA